MSFKYGKYDVLLWVCAFCVLCQERGDASPKPVMSDTCCNYVCSCLSIIPMFCFHCSQFSSARSAIERAFGIIKSSYTCVGTRRFQSCRHMAPLICNLTAAMQNRRKIIFRLIHSQLAE